MRDFGLFDDAPGRGMEGIFKAVKTWSETKPWGPAQAEKACEEWVPAKWRNGRNPDFYSQYKMRKITDEEV